MIKLVYKITRTYHNYFMPLIRLLEKTPEMAEQNKQTKDITGKMTLHILK